MLPVLSGCCINGRQQRSQPRLLHHVLLDLKDQAAELGAICGGGHEPK